MVSIKSIIEEGGNMNLSDIFPGSGIKVIAEIGINHNGNYSEAEKMIYHAAHSGADAVKFQTFNPELLYSKYTESLLNKTHLKEDRKVIDFFSKFVLKKEELYNLKKYADKLGVVFFSSPFDNESLEILENLNVPLYKIASSELSNIPLLKAITETGKPLIVSTGMAKRSEINYAVNLISSNNIDFALLHCVSEYPVLNEDVNLLRISNLKKIYNCKVGFSDHSPDIQFSLDSVFLGAEFIEKHFMYRGQNCPDQNVSIDQYKMKQLISMINKKTTILGDGMIDMKKGKEEKTAESAKRSLFASRDLKKGDIISETDIVVKRPGCGISPLYIDKIVNRELIEPLKEDQPFSLKMLK